MRTEVAVFEVPEHAMVNLRPSGEGFLPDQGDRATHQLNRPVDECHGGDAKDIIISLSSLSMAEGWNYGRAFPGGPVTFRDVKQKNHSKKSRPELDEAPTGFKSPPAPKLDKVAEADRRRAAVIAFMEARGLAAKTWAREADVSPGVVLNFLNRHSNSLSQRSLEKLAAAKNVTIAEIIGEIVPSPIVGKDLVAVPYISTVPARGGGVAVVTKPSRQSLYFKKSLLERITGGKPSRLGVYEITSDDMSPSLGRGDIVLMDLDDTDVARTPGIYVLWDGHGLTVKRLSKMPGSTLIIRVQSDNAQYPSNDVAASELTIIGRVIWRGGGV